MKDINRVGGKNDVNIRSEGLGILESSIFMRVIHCERSNRAWSRRCG